MRLNISQYYKSYSVVQNRLYVADIEYDYEAAKQTLVIQVFSTASPYEINQLGEYRFESSITSLRTIRSCFLNKDENFLYVSQNLNNQSPQEPTGFIDVFDVTDPPTTTHSFSWG